MSRRAVVILSYICYHSRAGVHKADPRRFVDDGIFLLFIATVTLLVYMFIALPEHESYKDMI